MGGVVVYLATQARHPAHLSCRQFQDHNPCQASCVSSAKVIEAYRAWGNGE